MPSATSDVGRPSARVGAAALKRAGYWSLVVLAFLLSYLLHACTGAQRHAGVTSGRM